MTKRYKKYNNFFANTTIFKTYKKIYISSSKADNLSLIIGIIPITCNIKKVKMKAHELATTIDNS
jgi:hypothetical protein